MTAPREADQLSELDQPADETDVDSVETSQAGAGLETDTRTTARAEPPAVVLEIPKPENQLANGEYRWSQLLSRDSILPIYDPEFVKANEAPYDDDELVIGVALNGQAKAYAIGPLNRREMVNDELGGIPILVTW